MSLRIKIWLHVPSTPSFIDQWNYLFQAAERKEIFNSYEWVKACAECIGPRRIALIAGFDKDRLVGLAPISMYRGVIEWLTGHWSDYCDFLSYSSYHSNFFSACCNYLRNRYTDWQRIKLSNVPENTSILKTLKDSRTCFEYGYTWTYKNTEPILDFDNASQEELKTILQKKGVERKIKTLSRNGILEYRMAEDAADIKELLKMFSAWHVQRFASLG
ncbi:MAG: hypothetical protein KGJ11_10205, partial [Candidatus Omnitrophica bacterium]|nr:hypothetical protein [Candidatus Omnitrophota bacterium]